MYSLDTYALVEIAQGNEKFKRFMESDFVISDLTLAEFYAVLLRTSEETAETWYKKLSPYSKPADKAILVKAVKFRHQNKSKNLSFFDCAGYIFSKENNYLFVTGDKEFRTMPNAEFIQK
jgi:predicted nucleic acid-binding protein